MEKTTLSTKGQIVLPKNIRTSHSWGPGTQFTVEANDEGILLRPVQRFPESDLDEVAGCLRSKHKAKALSEMQEAILREVSRRHDSGRY